ncbi:MAG: hypothetical protein M1434_12840 [Chloroflexi bacterium]|nr:hypothetical protein [Chloroflexota bacterium]MCL5275610.1 hypothetical protein [Chloroflexota bacterium]
MATINYEKEWLRIAQRLDWACVRLRLQLDAAQTDDERSALRARLNSVYEQIDRARREADRFSAKRMQTD